MGDPSQPQTGAPDISDLPVPPAPPSAAAPDISDLPVPPAKLDKLTPLGNIQSSIESGEGAPDRFQGYIDGLVDSAKKVYHETMKINGGDILKVAPQVAAAVSSSILSPIVGYSHQAAMGEGGMSEENVNPVSPREVMKDVTYEPTNPLAKAETAEIGAVFKPVGDVLREIAKRTTDNPDHQDMIEDYLNIAANLAGPKMFERATRTPRSERIVEPDNATAVAPPGGSAWTAADQSRMPSNPKFNPEGATDAEFSPIGPQTEPGSVVPPEGATNAPPKALPAPEAPEAPVENNGSGESAASKEAISRVEDEKSKGQSRHVIRADGSVEPLTGVDAVDARAPAGGIIVLHGPEGTEIVDRGGMSANIANGMVARAKSTGALEESAANVKPPEEPYEAPKNEGIEVHEEPRGEALLPDKNLSIISAERYERTPQENAAHTAQLRQQLRAAGFHPEDTEGVYQNGTPEPGFAVQIHNPAQRQVVNQLGALHNQESVLHIDDKGNSVFKYMDGRPDDQMGTFKRVSQDEAQKAVGYTRDANGHHYVLSGPTEAYTMTEGAEGAAANEPKAQAPNGPTHAAPNETPAFEHVAEEGTEKLPVPAAGIKPAMRRLGLREVRTSALTGNYRETGFDHETAKLDHAGGKRMADAISEERAVLRGAIDKIHSMIGVPRRVTETERAAGGQVIAAPIEHPVFGAEKHLEARMQQVYDAANERMADVPIVMNSLINLLTTQKAAFHSTVAGKQLHEGIMMRAAELGLLGPNGVFNPAMVPQAERLRQYLVDAYTHENSRQVIAGKNAIDQDISYAAGRDVYKTGRAIKTKEARLLEEPKGIQALRAPDLQGNRLGLNRPVAYENLGSHMVNMKLDQFNHVIDVLDEASRWSPEIAKMAADAKNEIRGQMATDIWRIGTKNQDGSWDPRGVSEYLNAHAGKLARIEKPEVLQAYKDLNQVGAALRMDRVYKGAAAQKHNFVTQGLITGAEKGSEAVGAVAGTALGHVPGMVAGYVAGKGLSKVTHALSEQSLLNAVNKRFTDLTEGEPGPGEGTPPASPTKGTPKPPVGEAGRVGGDTKARPNVGMKNKQRGGVVGGKQPNPKVEAIKPFLTDKERAQLRTDTAQRLADAFDALPDTHEFAAAALAGEAKKGWYRKSAEAIANVFGPDAPRFAALLAAMSPQTSVQMNFHNALRTFINWDKAGRPSDVAMKPNKDGSFTPRSWAIEKIMYDSVQKKSPDDPGVLGAWVPNAVRALTHPEPGSLELSGPKVDSFMRNLIDNVNEVTNDAWMATFSKVLPEKLGGSLNKSGPGKSPTYLALNAKARQAAAMLTHMTGEQWTPREVQETVWSWAKTLFEHASAQGAGLNGTPSLVDMLKRGDITDELIRSTPDFHQLFSSPEHSGFLESSRFGENAKRVAGGKSEGANPSGPSEKSKAAQAALRPHLISAAKRLEETLNERRQSGEEAPF